MLPPYPRVARHAATAVVATRCIPTTSSYMHQSTCPLAPITQVSTRAHASPTRSLYSVYSGFVHPSLSRPSTPVAFTHATHTVSHLLPIYESIKLWMQLKNYEGRTAAGYLRMHNTSRYAHTHACEHTAMQQRCGWSVLPHCGRRQ